MCTREDMIKKSLELSYEIENNSKILKINLSKGDFAHKYMSPRSAMSNITNNLSPIAHKRAADYSNE